METSLIKLVLPDKKHVPSSFTNKKENYKNASSISNLISYIFRIKHGGTRYCGTLNLGIGDIENLANAIKQTQKYYGKAHGRRMYHYILTFGDESTNENAKLLFTIAETIANTFFKDTQVAYAVHEDTDNLHVHFVFSAVMKNGIKWNLRKRNFFIFKKEIEDFAYMLISSKTFTIDTLLSPHADCESETTSNCNTSSYDV